MNDERCDRDRVTAILTLADELRPQLKVMLGRECPVWEEQFDAGTGFVVGLPDAATVAAKFCAARLLEALNTIDKARELHSPLGPPGERKCVRCGVPAPCPTWQALNGGNK